MILPITTLKIHIILTQQEQNQVLFPDCLPVIIIMYIVLLEILIKRTAAWNKAPVF